MKKTFVIFLILMITAYLLFSCNKPIQIETMSETVEHTSTDIPSDKSTESKELEETEAPTCGSSSIIYEAVNVWSLEEYSTKMDTNGIFNSLPFDQNADFAEFGFEFERMIHELSKDIEGNYLDYENIEIIYHNDLCTYDDHRSTSGTVCKLQLRITKVFIDYDFNTEDHKFLKEVDGMKIYSSYPNDLHKRTHYTISVNPSCNVLISIPEQIPGLTSEGQAEQILDQAIALAKIVRSTLEQSNTN